MSDALVIPPPFDTSWANFTQAVADAAAILRLDPLGPDGPQLTRCAETAADKIANEMDRVTPIPVVPGIPPPILRTAHCNQTVYEWRQKDAAFGVDQAWAPDQLRVSTPSSALAPGVSEAIAPYREQWGMA